MRVLLVKMSSLGDVVHTLAAVTDAAREKPGLSLDWVVEESYEQIPRWHPSVRRIIPVALRRWRRAPWAMARNGEWLEFRKELRAEEYDVVLDAQGLIKSALVGLQARGPLVGRSRRTVREPLATSFYKRLCEVDLGKPEVEQLRELFAKALGYSVPSGLASFGVERARLAVSSGDPAYAVLAHGAAWPSKLWPLENWQVLGRHLEGKGLSVKIPWGDEEEKTRAEKIAQACGGEVLPRLGIPALASILAASRLVVGLDTGLTHISIALRTPTVTLYGPSVPVYGALEGATVVHLTSTDSKEVDTKRGNTVPLSEAIQATDLLLARQINEPTAPA